MMDVLNNSALVGFYALAFIAIIASLRVIIHANPVHAILAMIVSLLSVAGIFFIIGAPFVGVLEIIVYAGAILVLFVFVIMMLNLGRSNEIHEKQWLSSSTWAVPTGLTIVIAVVLYGMMGLGSGHSEAMMATETVSAKQVGISLFTEYVLVVEVASFLLLAALVAAYHLGKRALDDENISHSSQKLAEQKYSDMTTEGQSQQDGYYQSIDAKTFKASYEAHHRDLNKGGRS